MDKDWYGKLERLVNQQKEQMTARMQRFFQVDRFLRMAGRIASFSSDCQVCRDKMAAMEDMAARISGLFNQEPEAKLQYDNLNDQLIRHLRNEHGIYVRRYFTAYYSVIGMLAGSVLGMAAGLLLDPMILHTDKGPVGPALLTGWFLGLLAGQVTGTRKDRQIKALNKRL